MSKLAIKISDGLIQNSSCPYWLYCKYFGKIPPKKFRIFQIKCVWGKETNRRFCHCDDEINKVPDKSSSSIRALIQEYELLGYHDFLKNLWRPPIMELRADDIQWTAYELVIQWAYQYGWEQAKKEATMKK